VCKWVHFKIQKVLSQKGIQIPNPQWPFLPFFGTPGELFFRC